MPANRPVALVTGAGRGIGRAIALSLAAHGHDLVLMARSREEIDQLAQQIVTGGANAVAVVGDVSLEPDVRNVFSKTLQHFGRIDILVNNAGIGRFSPVVEMKTEDFDRMWATNMRGVFLMTRAVLPELIRQKRGDIVNISSLAGRNAFKGGAGYCATKWALIGFARSLMLEVREHDIRVITVCPGSVDTSFDPDGRAHKNPERIPKAEDVASIVVIDALREPRHMNVSEINIRPTNPN